MLDCVDFDLVRTDHFNVDSMKELFEKVPADSILAYLKEINLFDGLFISLVFIYRILLLFY